MRLYLDIETLPAPPEQQELFLSTLKEPPKDDAEKLEAIAETGLHAEFGRILCIGYWKEPGMKAAEALTGDEPQMLKRFWELARGVTLFVGHNVLDFDLPFIVKRSIIHRVRPLEISFARFRRQPIYDTMHEWCNWNSRDKPRLDTLAKALGIPSSKQGIDGSKVAEFHAAGRDAEIFAYCREDVRVVRDIHRRMTFEE